MATMVAHLGLGFQSLYWDSIKQTSLVAYMDNLRLPTLNHIVGVVQSSHPKSHYYWLAILISY